MIIVVSQQMATTQRTSKFSVWHHGSTSAAAAISAPTMHTAQPSLSTAKSQAVQHNRAPLPSPKGAVSVVSVAGGYTAIGDVCRVAELNAKVMLDAGAVEKLDASLAALSSSESSTTASTFASASAVNMSPSPVYPVGACRAAVFARIVSLMQGKAQVRNSVIVTLLVNMLNASVVPNFSGEPLAGKELVAVLTGAETSYCYFKGSVVSTTDAFKSAGLQPVTLTESEATTLSSGLFFTTGVSCLIGIAAFNLISSVVDGVAALSCEGYGARTDPFDSTHFDLNRPHRGQMSSASNIRLLLEGSKRVNTCTSTDSVSDAAFHAAPQVHGPAQDILNMAIKALEIELNSSEGGPLDGSLTRGYDPTQSLLLMSNITNAIILVASASSVRTRTLNSGSADTFVDPRYISDTLLQALFAVDTLNDSLSAELSAALQLLATLEGASAAGAAKKGKGEHVINKPTKGGEDESSWTPEQRAKIEKKRQEKAEKEAAKAAAKAAKKSSGHVLILGAGSAQLRTYVSTTLTSDSTDGTVRFNPYDSTDDGFIVFMGKLLEALRSGGEKRRPRIPKGTRDYTSEQMRIREQVFATIRRVFKRHGGVEIDTPVFELREILMGKYGEDSKLIYDLADQGGELLSLRYDLTVPFARFLAMNSVVNIKRYHIAKVYRRDQPQLNRGRYREFYQCDFDIAGTYNPMVPDAEVITIGTEILTELPVGPFIIKLNHRRLLDAIFDICGVPAEKFRPICSAVDKLDKCEWAEVRKEMVEEKGLLPEVADKIGTFVCFHGEPKTLWNQLKTEKKFGDHVAAGEAMEDLRILFDYLEGMGSLQYISFDLSLARGLDYYTGVIYEAVLTDGTSQVGSISAGGRYDNLVGMFSPTNTQTPCVGISIGVERVFTIIEKKAEAMNLLLAPTMQVFIASIGPGFVAHRMKLAKLLWSSNISAEYAHQENPKLKKQMDDVLERGLPFMLVFGESEVKKGVVKIKDMKKHTEVEVEVNKIVPTLLSLGCRQIVAGEVDLLDEMRNGPSTTSSSSPAPSAPSSTSASTTAAPATAPVTAAPAAAPTTSTPSSTKTSPPASSSSSSSVAPPPPPATQPAQSESSSKSSGSSTSNCLIM